MAKLVRIGGRAAALSPTEVLPLPENPESPDVHLIARVREAREALLRWQRQHRVLVSEMVELREAAAQLRRFHHPPSTNSYHPVRLGADKYGGTEKSDLAPSGNGDYGRNPMAAMPQETLADRFAYALAYRGITSAQLAQRAGYIGRHTVLRYTRGQVAAPREDIIKRLADALGCSSVWLLLGTGQPDWDPNWK